jgi:hypothetical protein
MKKYILLAIVVLLGGVQGYSQSAVEYLAKIGENYKTLSETTWEYTRAVANDKQARKIEAKRQELLKQYMAAEKKVAAMPDFNGNSTLRDSTVAYLQITYSILNDDYGKIVDLEAIAEQSYDNMEAYLMVQEKANERMSKAGDIVDRQQKEFAAANNINLLEDDSKVARKLAQAQRMYKHYNEVFLIFFKCNYQETVMILALNQQDINGVEQAKNSLKTYADQGLEALSKIEAFDGDRSLIEAARDILEFYKEEAEKKMPDIINFYLAKEKFEKIKEAFDKIPEKKRTEEDVKKMNDAGNDYNKGVASFNTTNDYLNKTRGAKLDNWNKEAKKFQSKHT